mgnify:CR=1 FL=1
MIGVYELHWLVPGGLKRGKAAKDDKRFQEIQSPKIRLLGLRASNRAACCCSHCPAHSAYHAQLLHCKIPVSLGPPRRLTEP